MRAGGLSQDARHRDSRLCCRSGKRQARRYDAVVRRDVADGGSGEKYPITSVSRPTPTKDTIRSIVPTRDRSITKSFTIVTPSNAAPVIHTGREARRVATSIVASARIVQKMDKDV